MIDWTMVITSGCVITVVEIVIRVADKLRFNKEEKKIKGEEVAGSTLDNETKRIENESRRLDNDVKQMDVGGMYLEKVQQVADLIEGTAKKMAETNERREGDWRDLKKDVGIIMDVITDLGDRMAKIEHAQELERRFLNGKFESFLEENGETIDETAANNEKIEKTARKRPVPRRRGWKPRQ